jgi:two-component system NarL family sensor kinase
MNKHLLVFCSYILITCFISFAQPGHETYFKYRRAPKSLKEERDKILNYLGYARKLLPSSIDSSLLITEKAKALSIKSDYQRGIELSIYQEGMVAEYEKNYSLAIRYYGEAVKIASRHKLYTDVYEIYNSSLNLYYYQADYSNAMDIAQKGLSLAEQLYDKEAQAHYNNQIGFIYQKQEKADESIKYGTQYLKLATEINNKMMVADACNGIANGYLLKKEYKTSLLYFFKALNIYDKMNDRERFDNTKAVFKPDRVAYTLSRISTTYKLAGNYKKALQYALSVFDRYKKEKDFNKYNIASYYINTGDIYSSLKDYQHSGLYLNKGLSIARSILHLEDMRDAYEVLSKNFAFQKRYDSAYYYHLLFTGLKDSIINEKVSREINHLEVERRGKEIALLNQQQKLKETEAAQQNLRRNFIVGILALIAFVLVLLVYIQSGIKFQKLVFEKRLAIQVERQRISSDMHDDIGTGLSTMLIYVNMLKLKLAKSDDAVNIDRISALGMGLVEQMKEIVWSLSPGNDRLDSLLLFIRQYFVLLFEPLPHHTNIIFPLTIPDIELESELRRNIFLSVKESLNNIIKHANASCVELKIQIEHHILTIQIKDNGTGLLISQAENTGGNGLKNIKQRMDSAKGKFNIFNNNGVIVVLELDLSQYPNG